MHIFGGLYMKRLLSVALAFLLMLGLASPALAAKAKAVTMRVELVEGIVTIRDAGGDVSRHRQLRRRFHRREEGRLQRHDYPG